MIQPENFEFVENLTTFFESKKVTSLLKDFKKVLVLKIQIKKVSDEPNPTELEDLGLKCSHNLVVIFLATKDYKNFFIYWKPKEIQHFFMLKTYDGYDFLNDIRLFEFIAKFLANSLKQGYLGRI